MQRNVVSLRVVFSDQDGVHACVPAEQQVGGSVAHHKRRRKIDLRKLLLRLQGHPDIGLAARIVLGQSGTAVDFVDTASVCSDRLEHPAVNFIQRLPGHEALADSPLVRDDQDATEHRVAFGQRVQGSGQEFEFVPAFDVVAGPEPVDNPVAVQEKRVVCAVTELCHRTCF